LAGRGHSSGTLAVLGETCPVLFAGPGHSFGTLAVLGETCLVLLAGPGHSFGTLAVLGETWRGHSFGTLAVLGETCLVLNITKIALLGAPTFRGGWYLFAIISEKLVTGADARVPTLMFTFCSHCVRFLFAFCSH
jgi:hypothetical protein